MHFTKPCILCDLLRPIQVLNLPLRFLSAKSIFPRLIRFFVLWKFTGEALPGFRKIQMSSCKENLIHSVLTTQSGYSACRCVNHTFEKVHTQLLLLNSTCVDTWFLPLISLKGSIENRRLQIAFFHPRQASAESQDILSSVKYPVCWQAVTIKLQRHSLYLSGINLRGGPDLRTNLATVPTCSPQLPVTSGRPE
jgi:hypothetical protein